MRRSSINVLLGAAIVVLCLLYFNSYNRNKDLESKLMSCSESFEESSNELLSTRQELQQLKAIAEKTKERLVQLQSKQIADQ